MKYTDFTGIYPVSKTLRFELIPQGSTVENMKREGILNNDMHRADSYKEMKKLIDEYHKAFIERCLSDFSLKYDDTGKHDSLEEYFFYYEQKRNDKTKKIFEDIQVALRKQISKRFTGDTAFKRLFKKELIKEDLPSFVKNDPVKTKLIKEFSDFTTYFQEFHKNRKNMYTSDAKSTAIAYRIINENLPKFIDNINAFHIVAKVPEMQEHFKTIADELRSHLQVGNDIDKMFNLRFFNKVLTQSQLDVYNAVIGGKSEGNKKIQGINEYVNLYNQQHKKARLPMLKLLYKQILSDRVAISWLQDEFDNDQDMLDTIEAFYNKLNSNETGVLGERKLKQILMGLNGYNLDGVFLRNDLQLSEVSQRLCGGWNIIKDAMISDLKRSVQKKKKETDADFEERVSKLFSAQNSFSIAYINQCLGQAGIRCKIQDYFACLGAKEGENEAETTPDIFDQIAEAYHGAAPILNTRPSSHNLAQDIEKVKAIKALLDALKRLQRFVKPLLGRGDEGDKDNFFYGDFMPIWEVLDQLTPLYNKVRNQMTRKPYSQEKIKLNFENSTLLNGWDLNKEHDNTSVILRREGLYYLGIMNKNYNKIFDANNVETIGDCYEKMIYKLLPGPNKMLPKVFFSKSRVQEFSPSKKILEIWESKSFKKGDNFNLDDCHALIDFYKDSIAKHPDWNKFNFKFSDTQSYTNISDFYRDVNQQGYSLSFTKVSVDYVNRMVDEGKLYLFQIYNKDFSPQSKGTPNMHTLYWRMLFDERNLHNVIYKLNGEAEVFYRKASLRCDRPTHPAHQPITCKNENDSKRVCVFDYDIIKNRRYTVDKFMFHVPITINYKCTGSDNINQQVCDYLRSAGDDTHIIGIDRGERNLLYLVIIDQHGTIKEQFSLNEIVNEYKGNTYCTNYHTLLEEKEAGNKKARQDWQTIESIKELKEGYLSQVIHKISMLMQRYHAIVVLEDLNGSFMRSRQKVEKHVYQKFEHMLINKLNYLVNKQYDATEPGGLLHALQLTSRMDSFKKLGKQSGFLFYIPAWNTSKIDPVTGFVNLFDTRYCNEAKAKEFFEKFDDISYNAERDWFEFSFDYRHFTNKPTGTRTQWTLCTQGTRVRTFRNPEKSNHWDSEEFDLTQAFKDLFNKYGIDIASGLKARIVNGQLTKETSAVKDFYESLLKLLKLTLQMRNSVTGTDIDYLVSPVADKDGIFFDSRTCGSLLPANADANGAFNIARKGLMLLRQIQQSSIDAEKIQLAPIKNEDWLEFAQEKPYL